MQVDAPNKHPPVLPFCKHLPQNYFGMEICTGFGSPGSHKVISSVSGLLGGVKGTRGYPKESHIAGMSIWH